MQHTIIKALEESRYALEQLINNKKTLSAIEEAAKVMTECILNGGKIYSCGNGGSMCDAMHLAEEMTGRFRQNRRGFPAIAISDPGYLSCAANDFGYEHVFARFVEGFGRADDVLFAISTSGSSKNCIEAAKVAREKSIKVIALTGKESSLLGDLADVHIATCSFTPWADRVQELHIKCIHILIELCESILV